MEYLLCNQIYFKKVLQVNDGSCWSLLLQKVLKMWFYPFLLSLLLFVVQGYDIEAEPERCSESDVAMLNDQSVQ